MTRITLFDYNGRQMYSKDDLEHYVAGVAKTCLKTAKQLDDAVNGDLAYFLESESWDFPIEIVRDKSSSRPLIKYPGKFDDRFLAYVSDGLTAIQMQIAFLCRDGLRLSHEYTFDSSTSTKKVAVGICLEEVRSKLNSLLSRAEELPEINESIIRRHILSNPDGVDVNLIRDLRDPKSFGDLQYLYFKKLVIDPKANQMISESAMRNLVSLIRSEMDKARRKKKT